MYLKANEIKRLVWMLLRQYCLLFVDCFLAGKFQFIFFVTEWTQVDFKEGILWTFKNPINVVSVIVHERLNISIDLSWFPDRLEISIVIILYVIDVRNWFDQRFFLFVCKYCSISIWFCGSSLIILWIFEVLWSFNQWYWCALAFSLELYALFLAKM